MTHTNHNRFSKYLFTLLVITSVACSTQKPSYLYIGSFTKNVRDSGLYVYKFNPKGCSLKLLQTIHTSINPSFLVISPDKKHLFATTESAMQQHGSISMFNIHPNTKQVTFINKSSSGARNPAHVNINPIGDIVVASNYTEPSFAVFHLQNKDSIPAYDQFFAFKDSSIIIGKQDIAHLHATNFSPDGKTLVAQDLGADKMRVFNVGAIDGKIIHAYDIKLKGGTGPRHFTFHPNARFAYGISEFSGMVTCFSYSDGVLTLIGEIQANQSQLSIYQSADIHISPDGEYLYASNRKDEENTIACFKIELSTGLLTLIQHISCGGKHPRSFVIDPSGRYLLVANRETDDVVVFKRNMKDGRLSSTNTKISIKSPSSLKMME